MASSIVAPRDATSLAVKRPQTKIVPGPREGRTSCSRLRGEEWALETCLNGSPGRTSRTLPTVPGVLSSSAARLCILLDSSAGVLVPVAEVWCGKGDTSAKATGRRMTTVRLCLEVVRGGKMARSSPSFFFPSIVCGETGLVGTGNSNQSNEYAS